MNVEYGVVKSRKTNEGGGDLKVPWAEANPSLTEERTGKFVEKDRIWAKTETYAGPNGAICATKGAIPWSTATAHADKEGTNTVGAEEKHITRGGEEGRLLCQDARGRTTQTGAWCAQTTGAAIQALIGCAEGRATAQGEGEQWNHDRAEGRAIQGHTGTEGTERGENADAEALRDKGEAEPQGPARDGETRDAQ